ncbi:NADPH-dependent FMN reductase [Daejeonella lutea]|uniref:NAD(P)H-dependent FMN reductase n=1 Tax=Daejeonella lutea TaxID=572036 RepID=A0A1T5EI64_9SPHI|nr:NAD(P)H-dependent oxidoreductase [Daejeonella lutea]SKB83606.1 NAD(P)H-dependent FMN reductase [Daejeonella lutea]
MNIAIISGSARPKRQSHQVALSLKGKLDLLKKDNWLWDVKESNLPLLDYTFDSHPAPGEVLKALKPRLDATDAFVIVSPEHNASYPGSLKNSMDYFYKEYGNKPFGIISVSAGVLGGINAVRSLQQYIIKLNGIVCPQFLITPKVQALFKDGQLTDESYGTRMDQFVDNFIHFADKVI